tara:strand:+ start:85 stop:324 length:240 start_codon:yes stop_codon:yes gene_type:complete
MKKRNKSEVIISNLFKKIKGNKKDFKKEKIFNFLDSIEMMNFILLIEKRFKIKLNPNHINKKNFASFNSIKNLIYDKKK